ncbi:MAG: methyltransferase domain-containing protein [Nitrosomonadales bacterium]|nr:methyltransferase domain-containing protein [Nitrosomonadales bacterium]
MNQQIQVFTHNGWCPICEKGATFTASHKWFRDHLLCSNCKSIPRERAIFKVISDYYPDYKLLKIHETSPGGRGASIKLQRECAHYTASQYFPDIKPGTVHPSGYRCENLEALTFPDNFFDLFISQDVMEHIFDPEKAFKEIARVLKPGGAHIFTAPLINKIRKSERWASMSPSGEITHHHEPEYHGNPVDAKGALVTMHWGYDIACFIQEVAKTPTVIIQIDDIDKGIRAEYIDVLVSVKQP